MYINGAFLFGRYYLIQFPLFIHPHNPPLHSICLGLQAGHLHLWNILLGGSSESSALIGSSMCTQSHMTSTTSLSKLRSIQALHTTILQE
jgi:hypothetical protein